MSEVVKSKRKIQKKDKLLFLTIYFILPSAYFFGQATIITLVYLAVLSTILAGFSLFLVSEKESTFPKFRTQWFYQGYLAGCLAAVLFPLLPHLGIPFPVIALMLILNTDTEIAIFSYFLFVFSGVVAAGADGSVLITYLVTGVAMILFFKRIDWEYKIGIPTFLSMITMIIMMTAGIMVHSENGITMEAFLIPIINIFISVLLLLLYLKYFSLSNLHKYRDKYMELNDQECTLIVALKKRSKDAYFHAIHTSYFCDKAVNLIGGDRNLARAGGYYHRIGDYFGSVSLPEYEEKMLDYKFPPDLCELLMAYQKKDKKQMSKEITIVYLSDAVISAIQYLISKNPNVEIDFEKIIRAIFLKKMEAGVFSGSKISVEELYTLQTMFIEEKLYYDFLR